MKKMVMIAAGVLAVGAVAQEVPVPPPVAAVETTVAIPAVPVPGAVSGAIDNMVLLEPGARYRTFMSKQPGQRLFVHGVDTVEELNVELQHSAIVSETGVDVSPVGFCGRLLFKHKCDMAVWDGVFEAKKAGTYVVYAESCRYCYLYVNGKKVQGFGSAPTGVQLKRGANDIMLVSSIPSLDMKLEYRLASSEQKAKTLVPSTLKHRDEDVADENDDW